MDPNKTCIIFDHLTRPGLDEIYLYYVLKNGSTLSQHIYSAVVQIAAQVASCVLTGGCGEGLLPVWR